MFYGMIILNWLLLNNPKISVIIDECLVFICELVVLLYVSSAVSVLSGRSFFHLAVSVP